MLPFGKKQKNDTMQKGNIEYPNAKKLLRPQNLQGANLMIACILVVIAIIAAYNLAANAADTIYFSEVRKTEQIELNIARSSDYAFPLAKNYITSSNAQDSYNELSEEYTLVPLGVNEVNESTFDVFRLPEDVSPTTGEEALKNGIGSMDMLSASYVLNGGWRATMDLTSYQDFRIRYADFKSKTIEDALLNAINTQGFSDDDSEMTNEGVDDSGNTFKSGTTTIDGETYYWRVSALKFNDAYSIKGMPENVVYVGIRMTN